MASTPPNPSKKQNPSFPPKRGQIKAQIFESWVNALSLAVSKAGEALGRIRRGGVGSSGGSTSESPPPSAYNSDLS
ncbi:Junctophilin-1 like [Actinidia chinensis var. chinensis]|uniref:Junctophilin-1 like n=1 Tax=Actinidia chinensis var. chinensis TaxID=1590841 RepID=A0A2R6RFZ1_ACTCC|nr:Junctophilin-1 like [Actinidia chinensis var. chinensis]